MTTAQRHDTKDPRRARSRALKILFQADVRGETPEVVLKRLVEDPQGRAILDDLDELNDLTDAEAVARQAREDAAADTTDRPPEATGPGLDGFTRQLVLGVSDHRDEVDALIGRFARKWSVARMPVVDRNVLRLATYEMLHEHTSPPVVINEALELAKALSTEASGRYVNGVLEAVRKAIEERDRSEA